MGTRLIAGAAVFALAVAGAACNSSESGSALPESTLDQATQSQEPPRCTEGIRAEFVSRDIIEMPHGGKEYFLYPEDYESLKYPLFFEDPIAAWRFGLRRSEKIRDLNLELLSEGWIEVWSHSPFDRSTIDVRVLPPLRAFYERRIYGRDLFELSASKDSILGELEALHSKYQEAIAELRMLTYCFPVRANLEQQHYDLANHVWRLPKRNSFLPPCPIQGQVWHQFGLAGKSGEIRIQCPPDLAKKLLSAESRRGTNSEEEAPILHLHVRLEHGDETCVFNSMPRLRLIGAQIRTQIDGETICVETTYE